VKSDQVEKPPVNWTLWIMLALLAWGGYLAIGAIRAPGNLHTLRGLIIFGCTLTFLGFWWVALVLRSRRMRLNEEAGDEQ
jgi:hypothetical protein